jgi:hypothetical protein
MGVAWWITKAINMHLEYVILIVFPQHQGLHKRTSLLRLYVQFLHVVLPALFLVYLVPLL